MQPPNLIFIRHSKLVLPYRDHGEMPFQILADLGTGLLNPPIDEVETQKRLAALSKKIPFESLRFLSASPSERCQDTADAVLKIADANGATPVFETSRLIAEVAFDLVAMNGNGAIETEFMEKGISTINTAVFNGMVSGECESTEQVYRRVASLFENTPPDTDLRIFITHDFFLRVVEIFIKRRGAPYREITRDELESTQRNGYLCGFATNNSLSSFTPIESI